jgi:hypothetical protein
LRARVHALNLLLSTVRPQGDGVGDAISGSILDVYNSIMGGAGADSLETVTSSSVLACL